jgi:DNA modification methylase
MIGSPPYWEKAKKDVFAMIRQLGIPTWCCSFSAAETKWFPLLGCLSKLVHGKELNDSELENLTWQDKCHLIKSDPVTCARYFDHKFQIFVSHVLKHQLKPIGEIVDFFFRVEFQQRGFPHVHMLIWIKNSPVYDSTNEDDVGTFIDKYITCSKSGEDLSSLIIKHIDMQEHAEKKAERYVGSLNLSTSFVINNLQSFENYSNPHF